MTNTTVAAASFGRNGWDQQQQAQQQQQQPQHSTMDDAEDAVVRSSEELSRLPARLRKRQLESEFHSVLLNAILESSPAPEAATTMLPTEKSGENQNMSASRSSASFQNNTDEDNITRPRRENNNKHKGEPAILSSFFCPVTKKLLRDPVVGPDGISYEKSAVANKRNKKNRRNRRLRRGRLANSIGTPRYYPNRALQSILAQQKGSNKAAEPPLHATMDLVQQALLGDGNNDDTSSMTTTERRNAKMAEALDRLLLDLAALPDDYCCPITFRPMREPVIDPEGNTFDKTAIVAWLEEKGTSPITRNPVAVDELYPNHSMSISRHIQQLKAFLLEWQLQQQHKTRPHSSGSSTAQEGLDFFREILSLCEKQQEEDSSFHDRGEAQSVAVSWVASFSSVSSSILYSSSDEEVRRGGGGTQTTTMEEEWWQPAFDGVWGRDPPSFRPTAAVDPPEEAWGFPFPLPTDSLPSASSVIAEDSYRGSSLSSSSSFSDLSRSSSSFGSVVGSLYSAEDGHEDNVSYSSYPSYHSWPSRRRVVLEGGDAAAGAVSSTRTATSTSTTNSDFSTGEPLLPSSFDMWTKWRRRAKRRCKRAKRGMKKAVQKLIALSKKAAKSAKTILSDVLGVIRALLDWFARGAIIALCVPFLLLLVLLLVLAMCCTTIEI